MVEMIQKYYDLFLDISIGILVLMVIISGIELARHGVVMIDKKKARDGAEERANSNIAGKAKDVA